MNSAPLRLAIPIGDPAGIGPEVTFKALTQNHFPEVSLIVIGHKRFLPGSPPPGIELQEPSVATPPIQPGRPSEESGRLALAYLTRAIELARKGDADGIVTAPVCKEALHLAGRPVPGVTELLQEETGSAQAVMMMVHEKLRVVPLTTHCPIREVPARITPVLIQSTLSMIHSVLNREFGIPSPRIAVCGLNPHAGEGGTCGKEEETTIRPALDLLRKEGIDAAGPLSADTLFYRAFKGEFDAVVAMYHDQALPSFKSLTFGRGVNVTLGLPFVRTSPDHGTAFDIAGQGRADPSSMIEAIRLAVRLVKQRKQSPLTTTA
jgi:4-hydroxythreonine-4-phosphate dehydrogenase